MVTTCDVLVVGAGPGGGSAALHAARLGLNVVVIEDHNEIGTQFTVVNVFLTSLFQILI